jgi:hypothetical protein
MVPSVVHRMQGRVRLRLPVLTRIPSAYRYDVQARLDRASLPDGVYDLKANLISGSLLIRYDPGRLDESSVLGWVEAVVQALRRVVRRLFDLPPEHRKAAANRLRRRVEEALDHGLPLGPELLEVSHVRPA